MPIPLNLPFADSVLGAMITPAVLISACGPLALSTTNRLGRVVDRVRAIGAEAEAMHPDVGTPFDEIEDKREQLNDQLVRLVRRIRMLQNGLTAIYLALGLLVGSSLSIGVKSATKFLPEGVPVFFGLSGAAALLVASIYLVREARMAIYSTLLEMAYVRRVVSRKTRIPPAS